jgi:uncharacterized protein YjlB
MNHPSNDRIAIIHQPRRTPACWLPSLLSFLLCFSSLVAIPCSSLALKATTSAPAGNDYKMTSCAARRRAWGTIEKLQTPSARIPFDIFRLFMDDDGTFPNNRDYPVLLYKSAFTGTQAEGQREIAKTGDWTTPWAWGIFTYHHYHSNAWELLLCVRGEALVQLGGETGPTTQISRGDLILIPPGFAHKQLEATEGFTLLGSYPTSNSAENGGSSDSVDTLRGLPTRQERDNIANCSSLAPSARDPLFGLDLAQLVDGNA